MTVSPLSYGTATPKGMVPAQILLRDGIRIALKTYPARGAEKAVVLVLHGSGLNSGYYLTLGSLLSGKGYTAVLVDFRGHGDSDGPAGDAPSATTYREDLRQVVAAFADRTPLFIFAHSGSSVVAIDLLGTANAPDIAGLAMVTPTLAGDGGLTRSATPRRDFMALSRTFLNARPERSIADAKTKFRYQFNFPKYLIARATGLGRWLRVLSFAAPKPNSPPFQYTARAARNIITSDMDAKLGQMRCPVFVATANQDAYVNGEAIATVLPWMLSPYVTLRHETLARGDHFTATLMVVPLVFTWMDQQLPHVTQDRVA